MGFQFLLFIIVGFCAEIIDGSLGMAYGVSANTFLFSMGLFLAIASACVHTSEIFITAVSGFSHFKAGNVDFSFFKRLVIPGIASEFFVTFAETLTFFLTIGLNNCKTIAGLMIGGTLLAPGCLYHKDLPRTPHDGSGRPVDDHPEHPIQFFSIFLSDYRLTSNKN